MNRLNADFSGRRTAIAQKFRRQRVIAGGESREGKCAAWRDDVAFLCVELRLNVRINRRAGKNSLYGGVAIDAGVEKDRQ